MAVAAVDLCTLAQVQAYLDPDGQSTWSTANQTEQQFLITALGQWCLRQTSRRTLNGLLIFNDTYDGSGSDRQFVIDYPIAKVFSVYVDGLEIPSGSYGPTGQIGQGWVIDRERESISIIGQNDRCIQGYGAFAVSGSTPYRIGRWTFGRKDNSNRQNVRISYMAGPNIVPAEVWAIPGSSPWQVTVNNSGGVFQIDLGVISQQTGEPFTAVASNPGAGQYTVSNTGLYTFSGFDPAGTTVQIAYGYNGTPTDLNLAATEIVATTWKRLKTLDQKSVEINEGGTTTFRDWIMSPLQQATINSYTRHALVGV